MFQAGAWQAPITPPLGICLAGSFSVRKATNIMDDLYVHALALDDGTTEICLLSIDNAVIKEKVLKEKVLPSIEEIGGLLKCPPLSRHEFANDPNTSFPYAA